MNTTTHPPVSDSPRNPAAEQSDVTYAGFLPRAAALLVDGLLMIPLIIVGGWIHSLSWIVNILALPLVVAVSVVYFIFCHGRWGQTIGKMAVGIQVRQLSGASISWRQAWLRSIVDIIFAVLLTMGMVVSIARMEPARFNSLSHAERDQQLEDDLLIPDSAVQSAQGIWYLCELLVLLGSAQRRAIHDFIAGTVVVRLDNPLSRRRQKIVLWPCALALGAVVLLPILLPQFLASKHAQQLNMIRSHLIMIDGAKQQWALENMKEDGALPTAQDLAPYLRGGFPQPVAREVYNINPIGTPPTARLDDAPGTVITNPIF